MLEAAAGGVNARLSTPDRVCRTRQWPEGGAGLGSDDYERRWPAATVGRRSILNAALGRCRAACCAGAAAPARSRDERLADRTHRLQRSRGRAAEGRSEEHTSELQSLLRSSYAVFCLKKKTEHTSEPQTNTRT